MWLEHSNSLGENSRKSKKWKSTVEGKYVWEEYIYKYMKCFQKFLDELQISGLIAWAITILLQL